MQDRGNDGTPDMVRRHQEGRNVRGYRGSSSQDTPPGSVPGGSYGVGGGYERGGYERGDYERGDQHGGYDRGGYGSAGRDAGGYERGGPQRDHGPDEWRRGYGAYGVSGRGPSPDSGWGNETIAEPPGLQSYDRGETQYREQGAAIGDDHEGGRSMHQDRDRGMDAWAVPGPHTGRGPQDYRRSESAIREEVCERLTRHGQVDARGISVRVENGEVVLEGDVESRAAKRMAEDAVESVSGVRDVHNRLRVRHHD